MKKILIIALIIVLSQLYYGCVFGHRSVITTQTTGPDGKPVKQFTEVKEDEYYANWSKGDVDDLAKLAGLARGF